MSASKSSRTTAVCHAGGTQHASGEYERVSHCLMTIVCPRRVDTIVYCDQDKMCDWAKTFGLTVDRGVGLHAEYKSPLYRQMYIRSLELRPDVKLLGLSNSDILYASDLRETLDFVLAYAATQKKVCCAPHCPPPRHIRCTVRSVRIVRCRRYSLSGNGLISRFLMASHSTAQMICTKALSI